MQNFEQIFNSYIKHDCNNKSAWEKGRDSRQITGNKRMMCANCFDQQSSGVGKCLNLAIYFYFFS